MSRKKIAVLARVIDLDHDDRIRKECITLSKYSDVKIYVNFLNNRKESGITSYGIPYESFQLKSREILPSSKFLLIKSVEFYLQVRNKLKIYDLIWCNEEYTYLFALLARHNQVIWDLHEIPERFTRGLGKKIYSFIENKSKYLVHANTERVEYLHENGVIKNIGKNKVIFNYPDKKLIESPQQDQSLKKWLGKRDFVYLQGLGSKRRLPYNSIAPILTETDLKIVVVGGIEKESLAKLKLDFGSIINERIYFTGMINQVEIPNFIVGAKFSMIFYDSLTPNNDLCAPNRLYLVLELGVPVITGINEPMRTVIDKYKVGVYVNDDGNNIEYVKKAIYKMESNYTYYKQNTFGLNNKFLWESQEIEIQNIINS